MLPTFPVEAADLLELGILLRLAKGSALPLLFVRGRLAPAPDTSVADELGSLRLDPPEEGSSGTLNAPSMFGELRCACSRCQVNGMEFDGGREVTEQVVT